MTLELKESILKRAKDKSDEWGVAVSCRLESCADLVAEETIYHMACYLNFVSQNARHEQIGRPIDEGKMDAFNKVFDWLERDGDCELHTVKELMEKMKEFSANEDNTYTEKSLRKKLKEKYKEHIYFTDIPGRQSVVCFKDMVSYVLFEKKKKKEETKESIIIAAAKIIKAELRDLDKDNQVYPTMEELRTPELQKEWVSDSLQLLLRYIIPSSIKQLNVGQCIRQASRPRSIICPVVFGLGVQLEKSF